MRFNGQTYIAIWDSTRDHYARQGLRPIDPVPPPLANPFVPQLTRGQAAALVSGWKRAASRSRVSWPIWTALADATFARSDKTQRFSMDEATRKQLAPDELLALLWSSTGELASRLDETDSKLGPVYADDTRATWEALARDAWDVEKREQAAIPAPLLPPPTPPAPTLPKPPPSFEDILDPLRPIRRRVQRSILLAALASGLLVYFATRKKR